MMRKLGVFLLLTACSSIPVIRFSNDAGGDASATDDAGSDGTTSSSDAGADASSDTGVVDAGTCPGVVPPGAVVCCGMIPCGNAFCSMSACTDCMAKCTAGALCCPNNGGKATCLLQTSVCP